MSAARMLPLRQCTRQFLHPRYSPSVRLFSTTMAQAQKYRVEKDTFGDLQVPVDRYWGAQTQRSLQNFDIGGPSERLPPPLIKAFAVLKKAASVVNVQYGMDPKIGEAIQQAADDVSSNSTRATFKYSAIKLPGHFRQVDGPFPPRRLPDRQWNPK
ncbi:fumarase fum1 [Marasmius tenuissimus]|nr:fumarase fum1 [Marasmius tenuissimus]